MDTRLLAPLSGSLVAAILGCLPPAAQGAHCSVRGLAELPVTMAGMRPTITAQINGQDAPFTLDSGAFWSTLTPAAAKQYQLRADASRLPRGFYITGVGGRTDAAVATVATFTLVNIPFHKFDFIVGGSDPGAGTVGVLGQNILRMADIEYDLAQGMVRIFKTEHCSRNVGLAYWAKEADQPYSMMDIEAATPSSPSIVGTAYLDGARIRVTFDTGAASSIVGLRAADKAGVKPDGPGVERAGMTSGIGRHETPVWIATFPTLKIGGEEVHNARLRFADLGDSDMLLGADFFLSHRIFVASSQRRLYFTYNGGPVFNLSAARKTAQMPPQTNEPAPGAVATDTEPKAPVDATVVARRAAAYAARHDFEHALEDYNEACRLAPNEAAYFLQRGKLKIEALQQRDQGLEDINRAIELNPDYVDALMLRARLALARHHTDEAVNDLNRVDRSSPKEANLRLDLARLYFEADRYPETIAQLDLWIPYHQQDVNLSHAYNERCWTRAVQGTGLGQALSDCDAGLRLNSKSAELLDSRGLVEMRMGAYKKAIADYNAALKLNPNGPLAWTLYCRGLAQVLAGHKQEGEADMAAATAQNPHVAERIKHYGIASDSEAATSR